MDLGWRLYLSDEMSAVLDRVGAVWDRTVASIDAGGAQAVHVFAAVEERVRSAGHSFTVWASSGVRHFSEAVAAFSGQSSLLRSVLGGATGLAGLLHDVMQGAITAGAEVENLTIAFTTLAHGDVAAAQAHLEELQRFAVGKPFEFAFLATASRNLQTYGFAMRDVTGLLQDFGDAAFTAGTGQTGVDTMVRVFGQINTLGRMTRGHISQLVGAGVNAVPILREQLHLTDQQIQNIARSGIPAARIIEALRTGMQAQFGGGLARAAGTLSAKLSDQADIIGNIRRAIYTTLGPGIIPVINAGSVFLIDNAATISRVLSGLILAVTRIIGIVLLPLFFAINGEFERMGKSANSSLGGVVGAFRNAALLIEGVSALIVGDNGKGLSGISEALRDRLVKAGLWHAAVQIARFASHARAFLGGAFGEIARRFNNTLELVKRVAAWFGVAGGSMLGTRDSARQLGVRVVQLVAAFLMIRRVMVIGSWIAQFGPLMMNAGTYAARFFRIIISGARTLFATLAANPVALVIGLVVIGLVALGIYMSRNKRVVEALRSAWEDFKTALAPIGAALSDAWEAMKGAASSVADAVTDAGLAILNALRPAFPVIRLIASALAVIGYLSFLVFGTILRGVVMVALIPFMLLAQAIGGLASLALPLLRAAIGWVGRQIMGLAAVALPYLIAGVDRVRQFFAQSFTGLRPILAAVWQMLRVGGSILMVVLYVAFLAVAKVGRWVFSALVGYAARTYNGLAIIFRGLKDVFREVFGFLEPFVGPIFSAIASMARTLFGGVIDSLLGGLRLMARSLVQVFEGLPPSLRPAALQGAIANLRAFGSGKGLTVNDAKNEAMAAAPAGDANADARATINRSRAAPAQAAREVRELRRDHAGFAMQAMAAPPTTVVPSDVTVQIDGQTVARAVQRHQDSERLRAGGTVPNR